MESYPSHPDRNLTSDSEIKINIQHVPTKGSDTALTMKNGWASLGSGIEVSMAFITLSWGPRILMRLAHQWLHVLQNSGSTLDDWSGMVWVPETSGRSESESLNFRKTSESQKPSKIGIRGWNLSHAHCRDSKKGNSPKKVHFNVFEPNWCHSTRCLGSALGPTNLLETLRCSAHWDIAIARKEMRL